VTKKNCSSPAVRGGGDPSKRKKPGTNRFSFLMEKGPFYTHMREKRERKAVKLPLPLRKVEGGGWLREEGTGKKVPGKGRTFRIKKARRILTLHKEGERSSLMKKKSKKRVRGGLRQISLGKGGKLLLEKNVEKKNFPNHGGKKGKKVFSSLREKEAPEISTSSAKEEKRGSS